MIPERGNGISMGILDICMFNPLGIQKSQLYIKSPLLTGMNKDLNSQNLKDTEKSPP